MERSMTLLMPLLIVLASCGTTAQYSQQRYQDGIYYSTHEVPEKVVLLSKEDFQLLAAENIRQKSLEEALDSTKIKYVTVVPGDYYYDMYFSPFPLIALTGVNIAFTTWYWNRWHSWWGPWGGPIGPYDTFWFDRNRWYFQDWAWYGPRWYDPWYGPGWYRPGYGPGWYDPWYGPGWYRPGWYGPVYPGGVIYRSNSSLGPRYQTQSGGSRVIHSGSGANVRRGNTSGYGTRTYIGTRGSSGSGSVTRYVPSGSESGRSLSEGYNRRAVTRPSEGGSSSGGTYSRQSRSSTNSSSERRSTSEYSRQSNSNNTRSSGYSGGGYSGGSRGGGGFSGGASHSGGGGGSRGGRR